MCGWFFKAKVGVGGCCLMQRGPTPINKRYDDMLLKSWYALSSSHLANAQLASCCRFNYGLLGLMETWGISCVRVWPEFGIPFRVATFSVFGGGGLLFRFLGYT
jgi:hypothetical protein